MGTPRILVVDDTPLNLVAIEAALASLGFQIVTAASGQEALAYLLEEQFSLVLLDIQMPEMDGYELARLVRSRGRLRHLPIVFITTHAPDEAAVLRGYDLGAVDFLFRPVLPEVLRAKVSMFATLQTHAADEERARLTKTLESARREGSLDRTVEDLVTRSR